MKKLILGFVLISGIMIAGCGQKKVETETPVVEKAAVINTTHAYICPMDCENSASNTAGQCPVCGMDLVANKDFKGATPDSTTVN